MAGLNKQGKRKRERERERESRGRRSDEGGEEEER